MRLSYGDGDCSCNDNGNYGDDRVTAIEREIEIDPRWWLAHCVEPDAWVQWIEDMNSRKKRCGRHSYSAK